MITSVETPPFKKILVANRGEIAIRVFRAATELNIKTVAIFAWEDRFSLHRYKADESYLLSGPGAPVASYLNIEEVIRVALLSGAEAIHPGYGFLSERQDFKSAVEKAGLKFIGPSRETLDIAGDKVKTRALAKSLSVPIVEGSDELKSLADAINFAKQAGFPLIFKASFGGGGRGMRIVKDSESLAEELKEAQAEATAAFGRAEVFLEKYLDRPKHIEVQLLGDGKGNIVHLFERDCSIQRRHQKIVEIAPSVSLNKKQKDNLYSYATSLAKSLNLESASTAEFLVTGDQEIYFIEINPRIQVEHTVTEQITGIDIVQSQILIASGASLKDLGIEQDRLEQRGVAIQCRITTEDPKSDFQPNYGKLVTYRSAAGFGIRLDAGSAFAGAVVQPFYDSLLVKVTASGESIAQASKRLARALIEFRIRGVKTNIPFLYNILHHDDFLSGNFNTSFIQDKPELFEFSKRKNRANRLLKFIGETTVNGHKLMPGIKRPKNIPTPTASPSFDSPPPAGFKNYLEENGKDKLLQRLKEEKQLLITDTSFRDAHQSLLATRVRTYDMLNISESVSHLASQLFSLEMWGGATFDVSLRFLKEDPWERLSKLREKVPNILFQMLLRGTNAVGYTRYPDNVIIEFIKQAHSTGIDIFRIFDCLNSVDKMRVSIDAVRESGGIAEVCLCYTGDLVSEEKLGKSGKFNLDYYTSLAEELEKAGAEILAIKDMAGLLRPESAQLLLSTLKNVTDLPIHLHSHDTAGGQASTYRVAADAGVSIVDCAFSAVSGVTSQPSLEGLVRSLENSERESQLQAQDLTSISSYWEAIRGCYQPFESDLRTSTAEVYINEIPGGQYSNLRPQAASLGLEDRLGEIKKAYTDVNHLFGRIVKVTPSSKVVGDLALFMVANNLTIEELKAQASTLSLPESVVNFLKGDIGIPYGGFPEDFRKAVLKDDTGIEKLEKLPATDFDKTKTEISQLSSGPVSEQDILSYLLYPKVFRDFSAARTEYGNLMVLPSKTFFYGLERGEEISVELEPGKLLYISLVTITEPDEAGDRTVFFELNGQTRGIRIHDQSVSSTVRKNRPADTNDDNHVAAPLAGVISSVDVKIGQKVAQGETLFALEAMKMQTLVAALKGATIKSIEIESGQQVSGGDLVVVLE